MPIARPFGHEFVAEVISAGSEVNVSVGSRVVVSFKIACGECARCLTGHSAACTSVPLLSAYRYSKQELAPSPMFTHLGDGATLADGTTGVPAENYFNPFGVDIRVISRRVVEQPTRGFTQDLDLWRLLAGVEGEWRNWHWKLSVPLVNSGTNEQDIAEAVLSGRWGQVPGKDVQWVFGAEYRRETGSLIGDPLRTAGTTSGLAQDLPAGSFNARELFGEVQLPILHDQAWVHELAVNLIAVMIGAGTGTACG